MQVDIKPRYSLSDALRELRQDGRGIDSEPVVGLTIDDKLFVGGGCETSVDDHHDQPATREDARVGEKNVAICAYKPEL